MIIPKAAQHAKLEFSSVIRSIAKKNTHVVVYLYGEKKNIAEKINCFQQLNDFFFLYNGIFVRFLFDV